jgi:hypothetical protein
MKILIVHPSLKELGGAEQVFLQSVNALTEKNADIFVLGQLPKQGLLSMLKGNIVKITFSKSEIRFRKFQVYQKFLRQEYLKRRLKRKIVQWIRNSNSGPNVLLRCGRKESCVCELP